MIGNLCIDIADALRLPVYVNVERPSTACERVILSPITRAAIVQWHSGSVSAHPCRRRDMVRLLIDRGGSLGQWVNRTLLT
jgi:hypothetical protein